MWNCDAAEKGGVVGFYGERNSVGNLISVTAMWIKYSNIEAENV
jgi:hypothetical protein